MKIKLRDMTEEQYVKWRTKKCIEGGHNCENCLFRKAVCYHVSGNCWIYNKNLYSSKFLNQEIDIEIEYEDGLILNAKEKEYLEAILRPFKNRNIKITKFKDLFLASEFISICVESEHINFPYFETGKLYKGMEMGKDYTLEELGLFG